MEETMSQDPSYQELENTVQRLHHEIHRLQVQKADAEAALLENRDRYERMLAM